MKTKQDFNKSAWQRHQRNHNRWLGAFIILIALFILAGTMSIIPARFFNFTSGFCYGLGIVGIFMGIRRHVVPAFGLLAIATGVFFSRYDSFFNGQTIGYVWFGLLVVFGIVLMFRKRQPHHCSHFRHMRDASEFDTKNAQDEDGYVKIYSEFSGTRHDVAYKTFKGAEISSKFGGVILDLRLATIPEGETYIDVFLKFSGLEIYVPSTIEVRSELNAFAGGIEDKRLKSIPPTPGCALVIRGDARFGGITIKS